MNVLYFAGAVLLYAAWGALVVVGKVDANSYVAGITGGLAWIATHATTKSGRTDSRKSLTIPGAVAPLASGAAAVAVAEPAPAVTSPAAVMSAAPAAVQ
ncbi:hypothetical protein [Burkholderia perseverans]|uniref:hypothetical protein n=1 Tax=Burkholderia perseverans TaxID=2615214 RepID=UPI001FEE9E71|nr:hypothetical protein [Burkholderia perseverans]